MQHPLAFVPDKVQVVDVAFVTLVKADLLLRPVVLELPAGWRGDNKMHRPVSEEVHLSAVAVDYGVMALQGAVGCMGCLVGGVSIKPNIMLTSTLTSIAVSIGFCYGLSS